MLLPDRVHGTPKGDGTTGTRYDGLGRLGSVRTTVGSVRIPDRKPPLPTRVVVVVVGGRVVVVVVGGRVVVVGGRVVVVVVVGGRVVVVVVVGGSAVVVVVEAGGVTARLKIPCAPP